MITSLQDTIKLNNGVEMPAMGLGVFQVENDTTAEIVKNAIELGYRSIDTAAIYGNEAGVGEGIKLALASTGLNREDLFITSKVWNAGLNYEETVSAYEESLEKLGLDYLDLYLIHWPGQNKFAESWTALEDLYLEGKIRAIGVCNFNISHLQVLLKTARVTPVINQVEFHPRLQQQSLRAFCTEHNIQLEAWAPLMQGGLLEDPTIANIAKKYGKSNSQVIIRWDIENGVITIPKSVRKERMAQNADIFDFSLTDEEMQLINAMNLDKRVGPDPEVFDF
ncbi:diketogulonate reductase-like aldo/keto reductase [Solibacillus kalamii]|uniref:Aldo/keto reductase n=1 Tax=Solibacillus kalamii TaxID=1748298 RepID=A0ABX3ZIV6_9BACL|nr:aldo/keto reductase [Solibacillus kalamii]MBM7663904.1 diketogulonate reductase-like aldo/keto reductase [Solibacillus kalamii]OUZ39536.1 aldo/keto reductase [Solibacillus kalamii]